jgi:DNA repair protein RecO (recombination protein O)
VTDSSNPRDRLVSTEVIVLKRVDLRETDRIFVVLSDRFGKMSVIAKGVRRPTARFASHLELFARTRIMLSRGRELDVVTSAESVDLHINLRSNLTSMAIASHMTELVVQFLPEREANRPTYRLLSLALKALDDGAAPVRVGRWFEMRLLGEMGVRPELYNCVVCQRQVEAEPNAFNINAGGILCAEHANSAYGSLELSVAVQKVLRLLLRADLDAWLALASNAAVDAELEQVLTAFIRAQLERDLHSLRVMHRVEESIPIWESAYKSTK